MLQLFCLFVCLASGGLAGYADHSSANDIGNGYGYSGSFSGGSGGFPQNFPFSNGLDFNHFFDNFQNFQQQLYKNGGGPYSYSYASSSPNTKAEAFSSITFNNNRGIQAQQAAIQNTIQTRSNFPGGDSSGYSGGYGGSFSTGNGFGGSFSGGVPEGSGAFQFIPGDVGGSFTPNGQGTSAFGSIGPNGIQQNAAVFPENPNSPNVNVKFGGSDQPNGFKSVFTSSSSVTSNVDGVPKTIQKSITTVNDNGKITTYEAKSP